MKKFFIVYYLIAFLIIASSGFISSAAEQTNQDSLTQGVLETVTEVNPTTGHKGTVIPPEPSLVSPTPDPVKNISITPEPSLVSPTPDPAKNIPTTPDPSASSSPSPTPEPTAVTGVSPGPSVDGAIPAPGGADNGLVSGDLLADPLAQAAAGGDSITVTIDSKTANLNMGPLTPGNPKEFLKAVSMTVSARKVRWSLTVSGTDFTSGTKLIPVNRLSVKLSTSNTYLTLNKTGVALLTNQPSVSNYRINIDYTITTLETDLAGAGYTGTIIYTAAAV